MYLYYEIFEEIVGVNYLALVTLQLGNHPPLPHPLNTHPPRQHHNILQPNDTRTQQQPPIIITIATATTTKPNPLHPPTLWPRYRKNLMLTLSCFATFLTAYVAGSYSPPRALLEASLSPSSSSLVILTGITTFCLGFGLAPMLLAPFSELNGRYTVFVAAGAVYVVFQAVCGLVTTVAGMLVARFLVGAGASVFATMVGGVIADMWEREERNTPMALFSGAVLAGTGAGPLVASVMVERLGGGGGGEIEMGLGAAWRRPISSSSDCVDGGVPDEKKLHTVTRASHLKRIRWKVKEDEARSSLKHTIYLSLYHPFHLLFTEPVVFFFSLWAAFAWGVLYLTFGSIPLVFRRQYGFTIEQSGYVFSAMIVGAILATGIGIWQDKILNHPRWRLVAPAKVSPSSSGPPYDDSKGDKIWALVRTRFPAESPEARLYFTCFTSALLPVGLFIFGLTARPDIHWIVPTLGVMLATMGITSVYLAVFNYLADTYHKHASSALAAQSLCRNILGGVFPLVTALTFESLGEAGAGALLGGIAAVLTAVPWVLVFWGEDIRRRSPIARELGKT
ncbi:major facilitator superfamily domain-containing protein [Bombardia bombarda]|uniref:Major facilitator superfamily domain-containing protein n=1 Tax=Bombardia bombarda TaxID=252184 RepID=A0AA39XAL7_9PEZI|nr:major facilitator superfamily domain-containing protein [Bombardia bombarda]